MSTNYTAHFNTRETPQNEPIPGYNQVQNSAGGYSFAVDKWVQARRFLILGSEGGSYYASEKKLTRENATAVMACIAEDTGKLVKLITEISTEGRAPKQDPALFSLAMVSGLAGPVGKQAAFTALPAVARTATHLFTYLDYVKAFRGWGRSLVRGVANWYNGKDLKDLEYQLLKYRSRAGWSHRDALRKCHPKTVDPARNLLYRYICKGSVEGDLPELTTDFIRLQNATTKGAVVACLRNNRSLTHEMIPTQWLGEPEIWEALLPNMPITALIRNLGRMTANGLIKPLSAAESLVVEKLASNDALRKAKVHPITVLSALLTYKSGRGAKGSLTWSPSSKVIDALDAAFYTSFGNITPSGKRTLLALDVSGSMTCGQVAGVPGLTPRVASAALAMVTARTESAYHIMGFSTTFMPLNISANQRLDDVCKAVDRLPFSGTDCALPWTWAERNKIEVDIAAVYTDSETWFGQIHPTQALRKYREKMGIPARSAVVGMISNGFSIADPSDSGQLDLVGFDTATPQLISDFAKGLV